MNGHPTYLVILLGILLAVVAFAISRLFVERRNVAERTGKRTRKPKS